MNSKPSAEFGATMQALRPSFPGASVETLAEIAGDYIASAKFGPGVKVETNDEALSFSRQARSGGLKLAA